jgi:hypothetical protein
VYQSLDFAIGFFIAIVCLSSVMLALTLVYVSRLRPRTALEHGVMPVAATGSEPAEPSEPVEHSNLSEAKSPAIDIQTSLDTANPTTSTTVPSKGTGPDVMAVVDQSTYTSAEAEGNERAGSNPGDSSEEPTSPEVSPSTEAPSQMPSSDTKELSAVQTVTARVAPVETVPVSTIQKEETNTSLTEPAASQDPDAQNPGSSSSPSITVVNESEARDTMADKPSGDQQRDVKKDMSFSDLFTEDTEETEATRLGKELSDIDAGDIVKMTQNLASQLKARRTVAK